MSLYYRLGHLLGCGGWRRQGVRTIPVFHHLSLEHNGKSNIIIGTLGNKRQMCVLLLALCFPWCFMGSLRRRWGLLKIGHKSKTWPFFSSLFSYRGGWLLSGRRLTSALRALKRERETSMTGPSEGLKWIAHRVWCMARSCCFIKKALKVMCHQRPGKLKSHHKSTFLFSVVVNFSDTRRPLGCQCALFTRRPSWF